MSDASASLANTLADRYTMERLLGQGALLPTMHLAEERKYKRGVELATVSIGLGEIEEAVDWCEQAAEERRGCLMYLGVHPVVDPLRQDPRFQALVRKMELESIRLPH